MPSRRAVKAPSGTRSQMARVRPQNPEALAAVIAALRAFAEDGSGDDFERTASSRLGQSGLDKGVAKRMLARFDRLNPSMRERALGEFANRPIERAAGGGWPSRSERDTDRGDAARATARSGGARVVDDGRVDEPAGGWTVSDGETDGQTDPVYGINYVGFYCDDETTFDMLFSNSDEVFAVTSVVSINPDGFNAEPRTENHPNDQTAYQDVDKGEVRLGPVARCWEGPMPDGQVVSLTVIAWEHDYGDPNKYRDEIDALVKAGILAIGWLTGAGVAATAVLEALSGTITDGINWLLDTDDDQIDIARTEIFDRARMEEIGKRPLVPYYNAAGAQTSLIISDLIRTQHSGSGAKYTFGFVLDREPAFVPEVIIV
jgi:hypothetical protein